MPKREMLVPCTRMSKFKVQMSNQIQSSKFKVCYFEIGILKFICHLPPRHGGGSRPKAGEFVICHSRAGRERGRGASCRQ